MRLHFVFFNLQFIHQLENEREISTTIILGP